MTSMRGRPRKVNLEAPTTITEEVQKMQAVVSDLDGITLPQNDETTNEVEYDKKVIISPKDIKATPQRMGVVLKKLEPVLQRGFAVIPDHEGVSVTISKGRCSESINITSSDAELMRCVHRVSVAHAASSKSNGISD